GAVLTPGGAPRAAAAVAGGRRARPGALPGQPLGGAAHQGPGGGRGRPPAAQARQHGEEDQGGPADRHGTTSCPRTRGTGTAPPEMLSRFQSTPPPFAHPARPRETPPRAKPPSRTGPSFGKSGTTPAAVSPRGTRSGHRPAWRRRAGRR